MITLIIVIILVALVFDFLNGFHDAANSIATIVSTRVLTPRRAVLWAAFFNFAAAFLFTGHNVAKTIGKGLVTPNLKFFSCTYGGIRRRCCCPCRDGCHYLERMD
jgi:inorganic phosphate transporter, PiT family